MRAILSTNINIDKLETKCASILPLKQQVELQTISPNITVNLEATQIKIEIEVHAT